MAVQGTSRNFTISLPPDLAEMADAIAAKESRSTSDVLGEAFRSFCSRKRDVDKFLISAGDYARSLNVALAEDDVDRVIHEFRDEHSLLNKSHK
jgi:metal-responsive CopG/Arc/MetJ family transcriptional regulator